MVALGEVTAVILAAGLGRRWGIGDKLLHDLGGRPIAAHVAQVVGALAFGARVAVVSRPEVRAIYGDFLIVGNDAPEAGLGHSLRLAVGAVRTRYVLVCLADMPFVTADHLKRLCAVRRRLDSRPVASRASGAAGPPALFPLDLLASGLGGSGVGDIGARHLLPGAFCVDASPDMVRDIDTPADLIRPTIEETRT